MGNQKTKRKSKKKWIVTSVILVVVCGAGASFAYNNLKPKETIAAVTVRTMPLRKSTIMDTISVSGAIYSANTKNIYSSETYTIKEVYVKVGDEVKAGDVLAEFDMSDVDYELKRAKNDMLSAEVSAAEDSKTIANNIANAEISLETSRLNLEKQKLNYDTLKAEYENGTSTELINNKNSVETALTNLNSAKKDAETKKDNFETNEILYNSGIIAKSELTSYEQALNTALDNLTNAETNYNQAVDNYERTKETLSQNLITAKKDLENAELNYKSAQNSLSQAKSKTSSSSITIDNQKISIEKLQEQLGADKIIATIDGTITAVNVTVGEKPAEKNLFVIEDMNDLYVSANIMEYDLANISIGQSSLVTTDATDNQIFSGKVSYISPKAVSEAGSTTVEFESHIDIIDKSPLLRIGMNAFLEIIIASKDDVYSVTQAAVTTKQSGDSVIYAVENNVVVEVPVELGLETSTVVEISGEGLRDGMIIISNPTAVTVGEEIDASAMQNGMRGRTFSGNMTPEGSSDNAPMNGAAPENMPSRGASSGAMPAGRATDISGSSDNMPSRGTRSGNTPSGRTAPGDAPSGETSPVDRQSGENSPVKE